MNTLHAEVQHYALTLLLYSVQLCVSVLMDTLTSSKPSEATNTPQAGPAPLKHRIWTEQEISDLVNYLYDHRSEGTGGNFKQATFTNLTRYLAERHGLRTREAIQAKFRSVRISLISTDL